MAQLVIPNMRHGKDPYYCKWPGLRGTLSQHAQAACEYQTLNPVYTNLIMVSVHLLYKGSHTLASLRPVRSITITAFKTVNEI